MDSGLGSYFDFFSALSGSSVSAELGVGVAGGMVRGIPSDRGSADSLESDAESRLTVIDLRTQVYDLFVSRVDQVAIRPTQLRAVELRPTQLLTNAFVNTWPRELGSSMCSDVRMRSSAAASIPSMPKLA